MCTMCTRLLFSHPSTYKRDLGMRSTPGTKANIYNYMEYYHNTLFLRFGLDSPTAGVILNTIVPVSPFCRKKHSASCKVYKKAHEGLYYVYYGPDKFLTPSKVKYWIEFVNNTIFVHTISYITVMKCTCKNLTYRT